MSRKGKYSGNSMESRNSMDSGKDVDSGVRW